MARTILLLTRDDDPNRFHGYIREILLTEGYPWFETCDLAKAPLRTEALETSTLVMLCAIDLSAEESEMLLTYVKNGGSLVCFRPPAGLAVNLGLEPVDPVPFVEATLYRGMTDRWIQTNSACSLVSRVTEPDLQYHGRADLYSWTGESGSVAAYLSAFFGQPTDKPAIVAAQYGSGRAVVFTYDLATSTVLFHQGRREQSSIGSQPDYDADAMFKPNDFFVGYLDERLKDVPQADIHQDILVSLMEWAVEPKCPLPRLWYFPDNAPAVALIDGDSDGMSEKNFRDVIDCIEKYRAAYTIYIMKKQYPAVDPSLESELRARGHGAGQHPWVGPKPGLQEMRRGLKEEFDSFEARYGRRARSIRCHSCIWVGWTEMARYLSENGIQLDNNFIAARYFGGGYLNGSGLPVRFMDEEGRMIDVFEQVTISTDDGWRTAKTFLPARSEEECVAASEEQIDAAVRKYHSVYHPYFHPIYADHEQKNSLPWLAAVLRHCSELDIPSVSDVGWIDFNLGRRSLRLEELSIEPDARRLKFTLHPERTVSGVSLVFPAEHRDRRLSIVEVDGEPAEFEFLQREGRLQVFSKVSFDMNIPKRFRVQWGTP